MNNITQTENRPTRGDLQDDRDYVLPAANIRAVGDEYIIELEMPGVSKEGLEITLERNEVTIVGHRKEETPSGNLFYGESAQADYSRSFELGPDIDTSKIRAEMQQGILKLHLPKSEQVKPRKIQISG